MFTKKQIENFLFFDIETSGYAKNFEDLPQRKQELWTTRAEYLQDATKYPDNANLTINELYTQKSALQAEFGRVICVTMALVKFIEPEPTIQLVTYSGHDESSILKEVFRVMDILSKKNIKLFGHNIKRFDIPFLCKRGFINKLDLPKPLQIWDKKPWEIAVTDTSELWSFGAWQEGFTSLDLLCESLSLPSPKSDMDGTQVHANFYNGNISKIEKYCQQDVIALVRIAFELSKLEQFKDSNITIK